MTESTRRAAELLGYLRGELERANEHRSPDEAAEILVAACETAIADLVSIVNRGVLDEARRPYRG